MLYVIAVLLLILILANDTARTILGTIVLFVVSSGAFILYVFVVLILFGILILACLPPETVNETLSDISKTIAAIALGCFLVYKIIEDQRNKRNETEKTER